ncbi:MAG TPA: filamentous hemagglutinin N-terminal domain-containing protein, partial [Nodosilinea sp.]|nr:filamentous hemagglutinin N-terminal domain-containing protein [Nodosilinea sp.]
MQYGKALGVIVALALGEGLVAVFMVASPSLAQIVPDASLGAENSVVLPSAGGDAAIDQIGGGAVRGEGLFHSFQDFNVNDGQRVYFANPAMVTSIFSRVTGANPSAIFGTLGVLGNADLYLINPNGIIFGPHSELDLRGAFVATTSAGLSFANGFSFSATAPAAPALLTVNGPLGLASWLLPSGGAIASQGQLSAPGDLTLAAQGLTLAGGLTAGGNLNLLATDALTLQDCPSLAFVATAGGTLLAQGSELTISALSHPSSGLYAGGDLVLRSPNPVIGDAHYFAGGNFRLEQLNGQLGVLTSPNDPIIRASGDVTFDSYVGASLHILAGGSVIVPGVIEITGPDLSGNAIGPTTEPALATVRLSNGDVVTIDGVTQPTLDIRAGTLAVDPVGAVGDVSGLLGYIPATGTGAAIVIGDIVNPGGQVLLTNQYQPNGTPAGDIAVGSISTADLGGGGAVAIDSRGGITFGLIDVSGGDVGTFDIAGDSGSVSLLANGPISMPLPSFIFAYGNDTGRILLDSATAITQEGAPLGTDATTLSFIDSLNLGDAPGGDIWLRAPSIFLGGNVVTTSLGAGPGGDLYIDAGTLDTFQASLLTQTGGDGPSGAIVAQANQINMDYSLLASASVSGTGGGAGDVEVQTSGLVLTTGAAIGSFAFGVGDAGNVTVGADDVVLSGFQPGELTGGLFSASSIFSSVQEGAEGNSGNITLDTGTLTITGAGSIGTTSFGIGDAGDVAIAARESVVIDGAVFVDFLDSPVKTQPSAITSELFAGATGNGGSIAITTPVLRVTNGGTITALSDGDGNAGAVTINATEAVILDGVASFASVGQRDRTSRIAVESRDDATGDGGSLTITAPRLAITNGAQLAATTEGPGRAGNIVLNIVDDLTVAGDGSGILANTAPGSTGDGGSILIDPARIAVLDGAQISVASQGSGQAGNLVVEGGTLILDRGLISAETLSSAGGNITLNISDVIVLLNNSRISTTAGTALAGGNGGNIDITTTYLVAQPNGNNDITANAFSGAGGSVLITAQGIFGLTPRSRAELESLLGTSDPSLLDPARLPTSDITAISRGNPALQ